VASNAGFIAKGDDRFARSSCRYIAAVTEWTRTPGKRTRIAVAALVAWVLVLTFGWALRPIDDTVPVVVDPTSALAVELAANPSATPDDAPRSQLVHCNSLVDPLPRNPWEPLPELREDYVYERRPCDSPHSDARLAAVVNALAVVLVVAAWIWIARRERKHPTIGLTHDPIDV
jgi:hypothetical protein